MLLSKYPFSLWIVFPMIGLGVGLAAWLTFGLRFHRETSPDWQLVPYCVMLACAPATSMLLGAHPFFSWMGGSRRLLPLLPVVVLAVFTGYAWVEGGPYSGVRDDRLFPVAMMSASLSGMVVACFALSRSVWMLGWFISGLTGSHFPSRGATISHIPHAGRGSSGAGDLAKGEEHEQES